MDRACGFRDSAWFHVASSPEVSKTVAAVEAIGRNRARRLTRFFVPDSIARTFGAPTSVPAEKQAANSSKGIAARGGGGGELVPCTPLDECASRGLLGASMARNGLGRGTLARGGPNAAEVIARETRRWG